MMAKKALIVDDHLLDAELTRTAIDDGAGKFTFVVVGDGPEALQALSEARDYAVIMLDLGLPKLDGFEVLKQMLSKPYLSGIPVIITSNSRDPADRVRATMLGVHEFVEKSMDYSTYKRSLADSLMRLGLR